jgi:hypothetical protein
MNDTRENRHIPVVKPTTDKIKEALNGLNRMDIENKQLLEEMQEIRRKAGKPKW